VPIVLFSCAAVPTTQDQATHPPPCFPARLPALLCPASRPTACICRLSQSTCCGAQEQRQVVFCLAWPADCLQHMPRALLAGRLCVHATFDCLLNLRFIPLLC